MGYQPENYAFMIKQLLLATMILFSCQLYSESLMFDDMFEAQASEQTTMEASVSYLNGKLYVKNAAPGTLIEIFSMLGVSLFQEAIVESNQDFLIDLKKGYYIVKVGKVTKKISVK